ncbi:MAG: hypothetical protein N2690_10105, partial [Rhodocyclaceae bacterium]|nr:hypothetical protein [Rhodocyclaceae bacterium]
MTSPPGEKQLQILQAIAAMLENPAGEKITTAALAAIVVFAAVRLVDLREFRRLGRFRRSELAIALATCAAVL